MLRTVRLRGRVLPEEVKYTLHNAVSFDWVWQERGLTPHFTISIKDGLIDVECTVAEYREQDRAELHRRAYDLCRALVGLNGFREAVGLSVVLDKFINPNGIEVTLMGHDGRLPPLCTSIHNDDDFNRVFLFVIAEPVLILHLASLLEAISVPHVSLVNCGRVVDGIKHLISPDEDKDSKAWEAMRDALNIETGYLKLITESSTDPRHGRATRAEGLLCNEVVLRTWNVMNRFFEYRKRGNTRLPLAEFPLLRG